VINPVCNNWILLYPFKRIPSEYKKLFLLPSLSDSPFPGVSSTIPCNRVPRQQYRHVIGYVVLAVWQRNTIHRMYGIIHCTLQRTYVILSQSVSESTGCNCVCPVLWSSFSPKLSVMAKKRCVKRWEKGRKKKTPISPR